MHPMNNYDQMQHEDESFESIFPETPPPKVEWPFLIKGIVDGPACLPPTPDTLQAMIWAMTAVFGIVYALLGYRCLRAVGFVSGLIVGANLISVLQDFQITLLGNPADSALAIIAGLLGAIIGSTYTVASLLISAFAGATIAGACMSICVANMPENEFGFREVSAALIGGAIICAVLTLCSVKYVTILTSSIFGTAMILASIDFFMHGLETINWIMNMQPHPSPPHCNGGLLIFAWPVSIIISVMVQCFITAWRVDHRKRCYLRHHRQMARCSANGKVPVGNGVNGRPRESREEARQRKFRYLYQVRTARGDIISQNFVSALQRRIQLGCADTPSERSIKTSSNERNTFRSDRTHFTTIQDFDICDSIEYADLG